jgi:CRP/FNR family transcriptional regulator
MHSKLSEFVRQYPLKSFKRNETLIFQDDQPVEIFFIKSGFVKGYDIGSQGTEQLLWLGSEGDFVPLAWVFDAEPTVPYFFSALGDVEVYAIRRKELKDFLDQHHEALAEITRQLALRLINTFHHLNAAEKPKAEDKILYSLYFLASSFAPPADSVDKRIALPMTHQDIAGLSGLSRETASQELKKLKDIGLVHYDKYRFTIDNERLLEALGGYAYGA